MRISPEDEGDAEPAQGKKERKLRIKNLSADQQNEFPAKNVVDGGFLELVRYGIRRSDDPIILNTIAMVDSVLKVETDADPVWRRYNHDG